MSAPAGWLPDPAGASQTYRWWDGRAWTRWLSTDAAAGAPGATLEPEPAPDPAPAPDAASPTGSTALPEHTVRVPLVVALVVGVLVLGLVGVGLTVILTQDRIPSGPAVAPPPPGQPPGLVLDAQTRDVRVENVSLTLPGTPYVCADTPRALPPAITSAFVCNAPVHTDYAGTSDWSATAGLGIVADSLVADGDLASTGRNLYAALTRQFFGDQRVTVKKFDQVRNAPALPRGAVFFAGEVHYAVEGVPSRYDRMVVGVVETPGGQHAAFFSARPEDTPKLTLEALNRSLVTLTAR